MTLVIDVLIVEVIEEVIITLVIKRKPNSAQYIALKIYARSVMAGPAICTEHKQNATSKSAGGN